MGERYLNTKRGITSSEKGDLRIELNTNILKVIK